MSSIPIARPISSIIERYFEVSLYLLIATGFLTLAATGKLDTFSLLFIFAALLARGVLLVRSRTLNIPERWTNIITLIYVAFYLADFFLISGSFVYATVHLVLFVTGVKMFSIQRNRDYLYLTLFPFLMVLASAILTVESTFLFAFVLFLVLATTTFISMEMKRSESSAVVRAREAAVTNRVGRSISAMAVLLVITMSILGALIFFIVPRTSAGYLNALAQGNQFVTGFGNEVELGQIGEIKQSSSIVMHVQVQGDTRGTFSDLKWRGVALGLFDGHRWTNPLSRISMRPAADGYFHLSALEPQKFDAVAVKRRRNYRLIRYHVLMEPIGTDVFFLAPTGMGVSGRFRVVAVDSADSVVSDEQPIAVYNAYSNLAEPSPDDLRNANGDIAPEIINNYLQLPVVDPRVPALAQQVTSSATNAYDKAKSLETYLNTHYGYTLKLSATTPRDPIAEFLFERKQGHCEYFASSMAIMLRTLGIPSRVVNGFRGAQFNNLTNSYIVRASEAHTWVEAYFPDYGWITLDPTPPDPKPADVHALRIVLYIDALGEFWREWVINYDFTHQLNLQNQMFSSSQRLANHWRRSFWQRYDSLLQRAREADFRNLTRRQISIAVVIIALMVVAGSSRALLRALRSSQVAARPEKAPRAAASIWYERLTRTLARRGCSKKPSQTPAEFVNSILDPELRRSVALFTQHYERARFGELVEDAKRLPELYEEINTRR